MLCQEIQSINNLVWLKPCMVYSLYAGIFWMIQKNYQLNYWSLFYNNHMQWIPRLLNKFPYTSMKLYVLCTCFCIVIINCFSVIFVYFITRLSILIDTYRWFSLWNSLRRKKLRDRNTYLCIKYNGYFVKKKKYYAILRYVNI